MAPLAESVLNGVDGQSFAETYQDLLRFLYNIGFIGCVAANHRGKIIYSYDQPDLVDQLSKLNTIEGFVVHPAFRAALDIRPNNE
jgi:hypothetical protein